jgi:chaperonin cofactor prefoldin
MFVVVLHYQKKRSIELRLKVLEEKFQIIDQKIDSLKSK